MRVTGGNAENETRRQSTAAKIIIGREEIDKFGDSNIVEVLKRLPGVTPGGGGRPGRGGGVGMRGMGGGYTQMLINGEPMPAGFSLDSITPEQVERIEILRAPSAEFGARAIAGTINIVLRQALQKRLNEIRLGTGYENGLWQPSLSWTRNDRLGDEPGNAYNISLSLMAPRTQDETRTTTRASHPDGSQRLMQSEYSLSESRREGLHLSSRLQWRLGDANTLVVQPFAVSWRSRSDGRNTLSQDAGSTGLPYSSPYSLATTTSSTRMNMVRLNGQWQFSASEKTRFDVRLNAGTWRSQSDSQSIYDLTRLLEDDSDSTERSWSINGKVSHEWTGGHSLVSGIELDTARRSENRTTLQNSLPLASGLNGNFAASTVRSAIYLQDEWTINPQWSAYAGLRWEGIDTRSENADNPAKSRSSVWTPLLHALWKPDAKRKDQVRASLTRSYRAPGTQSLIARPSISSNYPVSGPNIETSPDRVGNPQLQPELATGVDLAFEHYLPGGGFVGINLFRRNITGLIRTIVTLEPVPWSSAPRWVARSENVGDAVTQGLELEARGRLNEWINEAPPVSLRANVSVFASRVSGVPGPNNRIDQQPEATANLGADYRFKGLPLAVGGNLNITPGYFTQRTADQGSLTGLRRQGELFAVWTFNPAVQMRLAANNVGTPDFRTQTYTGGVVSESVTTSHVQWNARLEVKL